VSRNEGWIAAEAGALFHTLDGGKTWERQDTEEMTTFFALSFDKKGNAIAVGMDGLVYYSPDNGASWQSQRISKESLYNVVLSDGIGLAVGDSAEVYNTSDGGKSWQKLEVPDLMRQYWLQGVASWGGNKFIAVGARGSILFVEGSNVIRTGLD
jgi:photosystem II stability/assembly factor-like uncharacterized protein